MIDFLDKKTAKIIKPSKNMDINVRTTFEDNAFLDNFNE